MRGTGSHFKHCFFNNTNKMRGNQWAWGQTWIATCTMLGIRSHAAFQQKCPTQAPHTSLSHCIHACLSYIVGDPMFFNEWLADPCTCAPKGVAGGCWRFLYHATSSLYSLNLSSRLLIFAVSNRFCVVASRCLSSNARMSASLRDNLRLYSPTAPSVSSKSSRHPLSSLCTSCIFCWDTFSSDSYWFSPFPFFFLDCWSLFFRSALIFSSLSIFPIRAFWFSRFPLHFPGVPCDRRVLVTSSGIST